MKTMTCKQLGGPCDHQHQGQTADEVIKAQDRHLKEMVAGGDTAHAPALKEMKGRWKHPDLGDGLVPRRQTELRRTPRGLTTRQSAALAPRRSVLKIRPATGAQVGQSVGWRRPLTATTCYCG